MILYRKPDEPQPIAMDGEGYIHVRCMHEERKKRIIFGERVGDVSQISIGPAVHTGPRSFTIRDKRFVIVAEGESFGTEDDSDGPWTRDPIHSCQIRKVISATTF